MSIEQGLMTQDEAALARRACAGDPAAFSVLVERYQGPVYRLCWRYVRGVEAEDLTQETFVRAFVHRKSFDATRPVLPWLATIARRLCLDRLRKHRPSIAALPDAEQALADDHSSALAVAISRQELDALGHGMAELAEGPREVLALYHFEGMAYRDIALSLDVPIGTVMTWLHRGREQLRRVLQQREQGSHEASESTQRVVRGGA